MKATQAHAAAKSLLVVDTRRLDKPGANLRNPIDLRLTAPDDQRFHRAQP
jgi:hypothetical protein